MNMMANSLIKQLSQIRSIPAAQLIKFTPNDQPTIYLQQIQPKRSKYNEYKGDSTREALQKRAIKAPEGWYLPTRREFQERIRINLEQPKEDEELQKLHRQEKSRLKTCGQTGSMDPAKLHVERVEV